MKAFDRWRRNFPTRNEYSRDDDHQFDNAFWLDRNDLEQLEEKVWHRRYKLLPPLMRRLSSGRHVERRWIQKRVDGNKRIQKKKKAILQLVKQDRQDAGR